MPTYYELNKHKRLEYQREYNSINNYKIQEYNKEYWKNKHKNNKNKNKQYFITPILTKKENSNIIAKNITVYL